MLPYQIVISHIRDTPILKLKQYVTDIDSVINIKNQNGCIVDSTNIGNKVQKCMNILIDKNTLNICKMKIAEFLCDKLHNIFYFSIERKDIIIDKITDVIYNDESMPIIIRLLYLRFRNEYISYNISCKLFVNGVREKMSNIPYFQILKYILRSSYTDYDIKNTIFNEFNTLFEDEMISIYIKMEIADIFLLNNKVKRGNEMLDVLREIELEFDNTVNKSPNTIYNDSQNVHDKSINESVLKACVHLITTYNTHEFDSDNIGEILSEISPKHTEDIEIVLNRVNIDTSKFMFEDNTFTMYDVLGALWVYIKKHQYRNDLYIRLTEAIVDMSDYCSSGHISRFISVIQGYTDNENLIIYISNEQQIKSVIFNYLDTLLRCSDDNIKDSLISDDKSIFYAFIIDKMNDRIPKLIEEYGHVHDDIIRTIIKYTGLEEWNICDNKLNIIYDDEEDVEEEDIVEEDVVDKYNI